MANSINKLNPGRVRPPDLKLHYKFQWFRTFPLKQRLAILFGMNLLVEIDMFTEHSAGKIQPMIKGTLTKNETPVQQMIDNADIHNA